MAFEVSAKLIGKRGPLLETKELRSDIARTNQKFAKRMKRSFQKTTSTWSFQVKFQQETNTADLSVSVFTTDDIYRFLDEGTAVRYATMSEDFIAKTRPGSLESGRGAGRLLYVSVKYPRPGIEGRYFAEQIEEKYGPAYEREMDDILDRAARKNA